MKTSAKNIRHFSTNSLIERAVYLTILFFFATATLAPFIANDLPLYAKVDKVNYWPLFSDLISSGHSEWSDEKTAEASYIIFPIIAFSDQPASDLKGRYLPPLSTKSVTARTHRHWLGTDRLGRDLAACMVYGARRSLSVALIAMLLAAIIGISLGVIAGYWENKYQLKSPIKATILIMVMLYLLYLFYYEILSGFITVISCLVLCSLMLFSGSAEKWRLTISIDTFLVKSIEIFHAVPTLLVLLALSSIVIQPGLIILAIIIGLLGWPRFARYSRAEIMKLKENDYVVAARISGQSHLQIIWRYILPEAMGPLLVVFAFGVSSVILLESTLSFLGLGVPPEQITWGSLLSQAKSYTSAWWLAIFPGIAIFMVITCLNIAGDHLRTYLNPLD